MIGSGTSWLRDHRTTGTDVVRGFLAEFKEFIDKGNLLGIAVGFVMGAAFTAMITGFVDNVLMPIIAIPFGQPNFDQALVLTVNEAQIRFGAFITTVVSFLLVAVTLFLVLKAYNAATKGEATAPPGYIGLLKQVVAELQGVRSDLAGHPGGPAEPDANPPDPGRP